MTEELNPQEQSSPAPEAAAAEATPSAGPKSASEYADALAEIGIGDAKKTMTWLGKMMPKGAAGDLKLPALSILDPSKKATYKAFIEDAKWAESRKLLQQRLGTWIRALESSEDLDEVQENAQERMEQLQELLNKNLSAVYEEVAPIERTYRSVDGFFSNAQVEPGDKVDAWFYNCSTEQLLDADDRENFDRLAGEIASEYKFFSLKNVYSNLVVPDFPGGIQEVERLAQMGEQYKVQVFADVPNYETYDELIDEMEMAYEGLKGSTTERQYMALSGNHLQSRERHEFEDEDLFVSPSAHLAGLIYKCDETLGVQESSAGYVKGGIMGPQKGRFRLDRDKVAKMKNLGIIPTADWDGKVRVLGDWNLSAKEGLDTYSRIRTEDWVVKNVCHYLNKQAFKNITNGTLSAIQKDLRKFLSECVGDDKALDSYKVDVRATPEQRARHEVDVQMELGFKSSVHSFNVKVREDNAGNTEVGVE